MERLQRPRHPGVQRSMYGLVAYGAMNLALLAAEARWHVLTKLTVYDVTQIKTLLQMIAKLTHHS